MGTISLSFRLAVLGGRLLVVSGTILLGLFQHKQYSSDTVIFSKRSYFPSRADDTR